jgi:hypothetical protein
MPEKKRNYVLKEAVGFGNKPPYFDLTGSDEHFALAEKFTGVKYTRMNSWGNMTVFVSECYDPVEVFCDLDDALSAIVIPGELWYEALEDK